MGSEKDKPDTEQTEPQRIPAAESSPVVSFETSPALRALSNFTRKYSWDKGLVLTSEHQGNLTPSPAFKDFV